MLNELSEVRINELKINFTRITGFTRLNCNTNTITLPNEINLYLAVMAERELKLEKFLQLCHTKII